MGRHRKKPIYKLQLKQGKKIKTKLSLQQASYQNFFGNTLKKITSNITKELSVVYFFSWMRYKNQRVSCPKGQINIEDMKSYANLSNYSEG